jgi:ABC-type phosphate transport system substrate-binding protein
VLVAALAAVALLAGACGGDDDDADGSGGGNGAAGTVPDCLTFEDLYALSGPESEGFQSWSEAQDLATELGSATELPDLPLVITAPGEESGTYGSYVEIALQGIAEQRVEAGAIDEGIAETTRPDYTASADDNVIIEGVAGDEGSFGWVGFAFADQASGVRLLEIDGGEGCVAPTPETIADGSYPLSRPLFIYVNTAKAQENPAVAAFVDLYMSDDGKASVSEADYIQLQDAAWQETVSAWEAVGATGGEGVDGEVAISGSSTVEPISRNVAEKFADANPDVAISVAGPGTSDGLEQFCAGEIDVADASRAIEAEEEQTCADNDVEFVELQVGIDGLSVITQGG